MKRTSSPGIKRKPSQVVQPPPQHLMRSSSGMATQFSSNGSVHIDTAFRTRSCLTALPARRLRAIRNKNSNANILHLASKTTLFSECLNETCLRRANAKCTSFACKAHCLTSRSGSCKAHRRLSKSDEPHDPTDKTTSDPKARNFLSSLELISLTSLFKGIRNGDDAGKTVVACGHCCSKF